MTKTNEANLKSDRFYKVLETLFHEIDQEAIQNDVTALRASKPKASKRDLAMIMTRRAAMKTATVGAVAGGIGGPYALLAMAPDIFNLVRQQSRLILSIAFLYDQKPHLRERFREVLATLALSTGASVTRRGMRYLVQRALEAKAAKALARKIAGRMVARKLASAAPAIGFALGGTLNYLSVRTIGLAAIKYYSGLEKDTAVVKRKKEITPVKRRKPAAKKKSMAAKGAKLKRKATKRRANVSR